MPGIEGLRALAAGGVVVFHSYYYTAWPGGGVSDTLLRDCALGVTLFFTLSGFLLFRPYVRAALTGTEAPRALGYLRNRALRIFPAYWVVLALSAVSFGVYAVLTPGHLAVPTRMPHALGLLPAAFLVQNYRVSTFTTGLTQAWSLAVELVFYLLLPVMGLVVIRLARRASSTRRRVLAVASAPAALLVGGLVAKVLALAVPLGGLFATSDATAQALFSHSFLGEADQFTFGMVVAIVEVLVGTGRVRLPWWWTRAVLLSLLVIAFPVLQLGSQANGAALGNVFAALASACVLALVVLPGPARPKLLRVLEHRLLVFGGLISYSVFLWHNQILVWLAVHGQRVADVLGIPINDLHGVKAVPVHLGLIAVPTLILAWLTYRLVELPALSLKRRRRPERASNARIDADTAPPAPVVAAELATADRAA